MSKWELRTEGCVVPLARDIESGTWIGHSDVAEYFVHHHNADIAALEAERDALAARINPDGAPVDVGALCLEIDTVTDDRDELRRRLDAILAVPEPEPPCPCKPFRWKQCTCGAYRRGDTSMGQIDGYADTMDLHQKFVAIAEGRTE